MRALHRYEEASNKRHRMYSPRRSQKKSGRNFATQEVDGEAGEQLAEIWQNLEKNTSKLMHASQSLKKSKYLSGKDFSWVKPTGVTLMALSWYFQWGWKGVEEAHREADEVAQDGTGHPGAQGAAAPS